MNNNIKICLLGGPKTGKTSWILRHITGDFKEPYILTTGSHVFNLPYEESGKMYGLQIVDGEISHLYPGSFAAIAFYTQDCMDKTDELVKDFKLACPNALIINVWSFSDTKDFAVFQRRVCQYREILVRGGRKTWIISGKSNYNFDKPFLDIVQDYKKVM